MNDYAAHKARLPKAEIDVSTTVIAQPVKDGECVEDKEEGEKLRQLNFTGSSKTEMD